VIRVEDWLRADNPDVLLNVVWPDRARGLPRPPATTVRRLRLFCCACARSVWDLLHTEARNTVVVREKYADGFASEADLRAAGSRIESNPMTAAELAQNALLDDAFEAARWAAKARGTRAAGHAPEYGSAKLPKWHAKWTAAFVAERAKQAEFVRDIFPPPGYTLALRTEWLTDTVVAIAKQMDATGDFGAVPILADALQDAGCDDEIALARCRAASGVHCRGNWVVDSVLGRNLAETPPTSALR
jgi:hypothetical protein